MFEFLDELNNEIDLLKELKPLSEEQIKRIENRWQGLPFEYQQFLRERGTGLIEEGFHFVILDKPLDAEQEVFKDSQITSLGAKGAVCVFGYDQGGTTFGFDVGNNWKLVAIDEYREVSTLKISFSEFIRRIVEYYPEIPTE